jgi:glutamate dehydrogenase
MTRLQEIDSAIDAVCARVRERLGEDEAPRAEEFVRQYYRRVPPEDLAELDPLDLYGAALAHWSFARKREAGTANVRVYNPDFEQHGWQSAHTVVELVTDDMPFLVDSTTMELSGQDAGIHLLIHPVIRVRRDAHGELAAVLPTDAPDEDGMLAESFIRVEIDRVSATSELERLRERLIDVLRQVSAAVDDWPAMRGRAADLIAELREPPPSLDRDECQEAAALLEWMDDGHFTFLGFAEYELVTHDGEDRLHRVADSGLGILREGPDGRKPSESKLSARASALAREPHPLVLTKANSRSTVHRPAYLDYVGVKRFGADGEVVGERRFLGLYTTAAYRAIAGEIPLVRRKVEAVVARAGFPPASHAEKALVEILDTYPRDELFQVPEDELFELAIGILALGERQRVRLFTRRDTLDRFVSCLVFLPRDRFHTRNRERVQEILAEAFDAERVDFELRLSESVLVRIHFTVRLRPGHVPDHDAAEIEARIVEATGSWADELREALLAEAGEEQGTALYHRYGDAFPAGYRDDWVARSAVVDIRRIEHLAEGEQLAVSLYHPLEAAAGSLRCKLYRRGEPLTLSDGLPMFESMGLRVRDERPHEVTPRDGPPTWIYDFGV